MPTRAATPSALVPAAPRTANHLKRSSNTWVLSKASAPLSTGDVTTGGENTSTGGNERKKRRKRPSAQQLRDKLQREVDNSRILNLTLDVNDLRQQVHNCVVRKSICETRLLLAREQFHARALQSVDNFFFLFRHGHRDVWPAREHQFLTALLDEEISFGGGVTGRAQFFEQWQRYKHLFHVRRLRHFSAQLVTSDADGCVIECTGEFEGHVSLATLETVFPHILQDDGLVHRVLGRAFVCPTRTHIRLDARGRFVQYDAHSDVFAALMALLDTSPMDAITLMANAVITSEGSMLPPVVIHKIGDEEGCIDSSVGAQVNATHVTAAGQGSGELDEAVQSPQTQHACSSRASIDFILS